MLSLHLAHFNQNLPEIWQVSQVLGGEFRLILHDPVKGQLNVTSQGNVSHSQLITDYSGWSLLQIDDKTRWNLNQYILSSQT